MYVTCYTALYQKEKVPTYDTSDLSLYIERIPYKECLKSQNGPY